MAVCQYGTYEDLTKVFNDRAAKPGEDHQEEEEESFVLNTLLEAADEGSVQEILGLLQDLPNVNLNAHNKHLETALHFASAAGHLEVVRLLHKNGADIHCKDKHLDTPLYWAARQGHLQIIEYLKEAGADVNATNKIGRTALHAAVRHCQVDVVRYLCTAGADINKQDANGETVVHMLAWLGSPKALCDILTSNAHDLNVRNKNEETALHVSAGRGSLECLQSLISHGADINSIDKRGSTPLHLACHCQHMPVIRELLNYCEMDAVDQNGDTALHVVCQSANLPIVQLLCLYGCNVNITNKMGRSPLHISAKFGHTEIVRCLLLSGATIDLPSKNNITAEMMALARGKNETSELLSKLSSERDRQDILIKQLLPSSNYLSKIKLKIFGESGIGKTRLVNSLKCGFFGSLLKMAGIRSGQILTSPNSPSHQAKTFAQLVTESNKKKRLINLPPCHEHYTQGIDIQTFTIPGGVGDLSVWEFSGYESYYQFYDIFIGDVNCIHVVCFNLLQSVELQLKEINSWLNFIKSCIPPSEPIGFAGVLQKRARVVLVGMLLDYGKTLGSFEEENENWKKLLEQSEVLCDWYKTDLQISPVVFAIDPDYPTSAQMKSFRTHLADIKNDICKDLPCSNGFLEATLAALPGWRRVLSSYPVVTWTNFVEYLRSTVNLLAGEEHVKELIYKLQLVGEVALVETTLPGEEDLVVLDVKWLCREVFGRLLSYELVSRCRQTGCFGSDDFQLLFSDCEAVELLQLLQTLAFCTRCDLQDDDLDEEAVTEVAGDRSYSRAFDGSASDEAEANSGGGYGAESFTTEYEVPCLNFIETLGGLWDRNDARLAINTVYAGYRYVQTCGACQRQGSKNLSRSSFCFTPTRSSPLKFSFMSASMENLSLSARHSGRTSTCDSPPCLATPPLSPFVPSAGGQRHNLLAHLFPRIQVMLRRHYLPDKSNSEVDLYQWHRGSKYCRGLLEVMVTYEPCAVDFATPNGVKCACDCGRGFVELKYRGPSDMATELFEFAECIKEVIKSTVRLCFPSLDYRQEVLSSSHLSDHRRQVRSYSQREVIEAFSDPEGDFVVSFVECNGRECCESLLDLLALGSEIVYNRLVPAPNLGVSSLSLGVRRKLASLLDPVDVTGCDWCMLAILLGLSDQMPTLDSKDDYSSFCPSYSSPNSSSSSSNPLSRTEKVLEVWSRDDSDKSKSLIGVLVSKLRDLNRLDAVDVIMTSGPLYEFQKAEAKSECLDFISDYSHEAATDQYSNGGAPYRQFGEGFDRSFGNSDFLF